MKARRVLFSLLLALSLFAGCVGCGSQGSNSEATEGESSAESSESDDGTSAVIEGEVVTETLAIFAMDTYMSLTAYGVYAAEALEAAEAEINRLDDLFSVGNAESEIAIVNETGSVTVCEDTAYLLQRWMEVYESTEGLFDITVYPLMVEWGFTSQEYQIPAQSAIDALLVNVGASGLSFDSTTNLLELAEGVGIDLGGIVKGYACERIMAVFEEYGLVGGVASLGGDVQVYGSKLDGSTYKIAIQDPEGSSDYIGILSMTDGMSVLTSGDYERYFEEDGVRYHHIIDPSTGWPADTGLTSVTIVSTDATAADMLATALFVMGKDEAITYWSQHKDEFDVIFIETDGSLTITSGLADCFSSDLSYEIAYGE